MVLQGSSSHEFISQKLAVAPVFDLLRSPSMDGFGLWAGGKMLLFGLALAQQRAAGTFNTSNLQNETIFQILR